MQSEEPPTKRVWVEEPAKEKETFTFIVNGVTRSIKAYSTKPFSQSDVWHAMGMLHLGGRS